MGLAGPEDRQSGAVFTQDFDMHDDDHKERADQGTETSPRDSAASDDRYARPPTERQRKSGQNPHGNADHPQADEYGYGEANPHGPQHEQGGQYPGTRTQHDPYYRQGAPGQESRRRQAQAHEAAAGRLSSAGQADTASADPASERLRSALLARLRERGLMMTDVHVQVDGSTALLSGDVPDAETRLAIAHCASLHAGIETVVNRIKIIAQDGYGGPVA